MVTQLKIYTAFTAGDQTKMDRSFPSCTTEHVHQQRQNGCFRDGIQRSNRVWICCCSLMKSWLIMFFFNTKFALVRSDDWWVSFTRPWAVFTRLGRPDEWLVRTLTTLTLGTFRHRTAGTFPVPSFGHHSIGPQRRTGRGVFTGVDLGPAIRLRTVGPEAPGHKVPRRLAGLGSLPRFPGVLLPFLCQANKRL